MKLLVARNSNLKVCLLVFGLIVGCDNNSRIGNGPSITAKPGDSPESVTNPNPATQPPSAEELHAESAKADDGPVLLADLLEIVQQLSQIDDEDFGKYSLEKRRRWDEKFSTLQKLGSKQAPVVLEMLSHDDPYARACAAAVLGKEKLRNAVPALITALSDSKPIVRGCAALALGWIGDDEALMPLIAAMDDELSAVRGEVARALGDFASPRAVKSLIVAIKEKGDGYSCGVYTPIVVLTLHRLSYPGQYNGPVTYALVQIGPGAVDELNQALTDPSGENHVFIAWALGEIAKKYDNVPAISALIHARDGSHDEVRALIDATINDVKNLQDPGSTELRKILSKRTQP